MNEETRDYKSQTTYVSKDKDTDSKVATAITFEAKLSTFEMDIMKSMGIEEEREPGKSYWY